MERDANGAPKLQPVTVPYPEGYPPRKGWFLHHMPHGMMMIYWGIKDGVECVAQVDARFVVFDAPTDVAGHPSPPAADFGAGYTPIERG